MKIMGIADTVLTCAVYIIDDGHVLLKTAFDLFLESGVSRSVCFWDLRRWVSWVRIHVCPGLRQALQPALKLILR